MATPLTGLSGSQAPGLLRGQTTAVGTLVHRESASALAPVLKAGQAAGGIKAQADASARSYQQGYQRVSVELLRVTRLEMARAIRSSAESALTQPESSLAPRTLRVYADQKLTGLVVDLFA